MAFKEQREEIIAVAKKLLSDGEIGCVLGYSTNETDGKAIPRFFRSPEELDGMRWDEGCTPNLSIYLPEKQNEKIAIVAKACDSRIIVMYLAEGQIKRENVYIIGVECAGMISSEAASAGIENTNTKEKRPAAPGCDGCGTRTPPLADIVVKNTDMLPGHVQVAGVNSALNGQNDGKRADDNEHSLGRFQKEIGKCILCFACRQACYGCYCKTCFIERGIPNWLPSSVDEGTKMVFHLGRTMHLAGRCVECGACERVCPSGVKIRYLIKEITNASESLYGAKAGMDINTADALSVFDPNDREIGFMGGEQQ